MDQLLADAIGCRQILCQKLILIPFYLEKLLEVLHICSQWENSCEITPSRIFFL